ncbi:helix-turn-helix domain-containing protein [Micromonospora avicenniae]|uniref:helix-turn-helix domain-containing protein n=1 Tax=Micromonospora avicenniae TaxID=1198245 RepID=UPI0034349497
MVEDSDWVTVGEQIRQARLGAGMSQAELANRIGLDRTMIAKVEAGGRRVDALELIRLASALDVPIDYLLRRRPAVISHRAELLAEDNDTEAARRSQRLDITLSAWLGDVRQMVDAGLLRPNAPMHYTGQVGSEADARAAARWLREAHGAGEEPIATLMEFSERSGQYVLVGDLPGDGASLTEGDIAVAVVSLNGDHGRRRATAAHELGHLVLGDEYSSDLAVHLSRADREAMINAFAAELLLPLAAFTGRPHGGNLREEIIRLAARYRTSWSLALRQAERADWLDATTRRSLSQATPTQAEFMDAVGWSPQPDLNAVRVPPGYSHAVMEAWRRDLVTNARAVELLHGQITRDDLPTRDEADSPL